MRLLAAALAAVLLATACGGGGEDTKPSPAGNFADATCNDLAQWAAAIQTAFNDLVNIGSLDVSDRTEVATVVGRLTTSLGAAEQATDALAKGIDGRPAPDISSGADVKKLLVTGFTGLRELLGTTRAKLTDFDPATATVEEATALRNDLANLEGAALDKVAGVSVLSENEDLRKAFEGSQTCKDASSGLVGAST